MTAPPAAPAAKVYLVGAGPGDERLLTVGAADLLRRADAVLYDRLVGEGVLAMIPRTARRVYVGRAVGDDTAHQDATNRAMLEAAESAGPRGTVVRLKGGDPTIFGRGGEEAEFLARHGVPCELVPGITSGAGSAAYEGIPLTHRAVSSSVAFVAGHEDPCKKRGAVPWRLLAGSVDTIVVMMGLSRIRRICDELVAGGLDPSTPVAVVENGTTPRHRSVRGTLSDIDRAVESAGVRPPANIIIGAVSGLPPLGARAAPAAGRGGRAGAAKRGNAGSRGGKTEKPRAARRPAEAAGRAAPAGPRKAAGRAAPAGPRKAAGGSRPGKPAKPGAPKAGKNAPRRSASARRASKGKGGAS